MAFLRIVGLAVLAAIAYGIVHDQVTARICVEYFTIAHPLYIATSSPTVLAFEWGILATWWVGLPLGVLLASAARIGGRPRLTARDLVRPIGVVLGAMYVCAAVAGLIGGILASRGQVWLVEPYATWIPRDRHVPFLIDAWAHSASYASGFVGAIVLCAWTWRVRGRRRGTDVARAAVLAIG